MLDVKGELAFGDERHGFPGTAGFRGTLGPVIVFRADARGFRLLQSAVRSAPRRQRSARRAEHRRNHRRSGRRWAPSRISGTARQASDASAVILHVLYAEPLQRKNLAVVREKLRDLRHTAEEMRTTLHRRNPETDVPEVHPEVLHAAESFLAGEERLQSGIKATAESFFGLFADPIVAEKTATSDFRIADLMCGDKPVTLYLQPPPSDAQRLMPLMRLVLNQIARALMESQTHA